MSPAAAYTLAVLVLMVAGLVRGWARTDLVMLGALGLLLVARIVEPEAAFAGFANPAVVAIASLFVVAAGVDRTGALGFLDDLLRPRSAHPGPALLRLMAPTALLSGVLNNTPIVAMLIPRVQAWAEARGPAASKMLIPLSTAAIVGGWLTLIGTSTNVVVHGLLQAEGLAGFEFFTLSWIGVPAMLAVLVYYAAVGHRLLPERPSAARVSAGGYAFDLAVADGAPFTGQTVEDAGFRDLGTAFLARRRREGVAREVRPQDTLLPGDVLTFVGAPTALDALSLRAGLERTTPGHADVDVSETELSLFEAVVGAGSRLEGRTLQEVGFRERYGGVVLGIRRGSAPVEGGLGREPLRAGDLLLVEGRPAMVSRLVGSEDFTLVAPLDAVRPVGRLAPLALAILVGTIALAATGALPLATATFAGALAMVATGCLRGAALRRAVDVPVILTIGAALGIGQAVEATGLADMAAVGVEAVAGVGGAVAALVALYAVTNVLAELVTNKAAAVLMLPVALAVAADLGAPWLPFAVVVTIASAASFLTPVGYQTNLMVMAAGGYRYTDYARAGAPVALIVGAVTVAVATIAWL